MNARRPIGQPENYKTGETGWHVALSDTYPRTIWIQACDIYRSSVEHSRSTKSQTRQPLATSMQVVVGQ